MKLFIKALLITFTLIQAVQAGRYYNTENGRFISRDSAGYIDGMSLYNAYFAEKFSLDPSGNFKLEFNAFIPQNIAGAKTLGKWFPKVGHVDNDTWIDEAGSTAWVMATDQRGFGGGKSRLKSLSREIDTSEIGNMEGKGKVFNTSSDDSIRAKEAHLTFSYVYEQKNARPSGDEVIKDVSPCETHITVTASAEYPFKGWQIGNWGVFSAFIPNLDYKVTFKLKRFDDAGFSVGTVEGTHNKFPNYEANINGVWLYSFSSAVTPGMIDSSIGLQTNTDFTGKASIFLD